MKAVNIPELSPEFAYFLGLLLGDGSVMESKPTIALTGHEVDEEEFCMNVLLPLITTLFGFTPRVYKPRGIHAYRIMFDSRKLVTFLIHEIGFPHGQAPKRIPEVILTASLETQIAFVRGLFDADGSVIFSKKTYSQYSYPSVETKSTSRPVLSEIEPILSRLGFRVSIGRSVESHVLRINGREMLDRWFEVVGSKNIKHLSKYRVWKKLGYCPPQTNVPNRLALLQGNVPSPLL